MTHQTLLVSVLYFMKNCSYRSLFFKFLSLYVIIIVMTVTHQSPVFQIMLHTPIYKKKGFYGKFFAFHELLAKRWEMLLYGYMYRNNWLITSTKHTTGSQGQTHLRVNTLQSLTIMKLFEPCQCDGKVLYSRSHCFVLSSSIIQLLIGMHFLSSSLWI